MNQEDLKALIALMKSTTSGDLSGESTALALQEANDILKRNKTTWQEALTFKSNAFAELLGIEEASDRDFPPRPERSSGRSEVEWEHNLDSDEVEEAFDLVMGSQPSETFGKLISSIYAQWQDRGTLSKKQAKTLFDGAALVRNRGS